MKVARCHHPRHQHHPYHRQRTSWPTRLRRSRRRNPPGRRRDPREGEALATTAWHRRRSRTARLRVQSFSSPTERCVTRERRGAQPKNKNYKYNSFASLLSERHPALDTAHARLTRVTRRASRDDTLACVPDSRRSGCPPRPRTTEPNPDAALIPHVRRRVHSTASWEGPSTAWTLWFASTTSKSKAPRRERRWELRRRGF